MATPSLNYTAAGTQFSIPASETEQTDITAFMINALAALEGHTHNGTTRGLAVAAAAAGGLTGATLAANVLASSLTSVGTLTNLTVGNGLTVAAGGFVVTAGGENITGLATFNTGLTVTGTLTLLTATSRIVPGTTSLSLRNNADSADNLLISNAGVVTVRAGLTVTAGGATVTAGDLAFGGTAQRITGDFSNATPATRTAFQSSTANGQTVVGAVPNGSSTLARFIAYNTNDPTNAGAFALNNAGTAARLITSVAGTGTEPATLEVTSAAGTILSANTATRALTVVGTIGFNNAAPIAKPTVTGAKGGNAALASLLTALANYGLVTDSTTA